MREDINLGLILRQTLALMGRDVIAVALILGALAAIGTFTDLYAPEAGNLLGIPAMVLQYYTIRRLVDREGLRSADRIAGFGSFFVLGLVSGLAILLGFVCLVIPGIYLAGRWAMADAVLLAENRGSSAALGRSWSLTARHGVTVSLAFLAAAIPGFVAGGLTLYFAYFYAADDPTNTPVTDIVFNLCMYGSQVAGWYLGVALYGLFADPREDRLGAVFA